MITKKKTFLVYVLDQTDQAKKWSITEKLKCQMLETFEKTKRE